jgi:nucleotide-binding universal stress UspA family protein
MFKRILVCVDGSECGKHAARITVVLATKFGSDVILVNVCDIGLALAPYMMVPEAVPDVKGIEESLNEAQKAILADTQAFFEETGITSKPRAETGQPVETILRVAEQEEVDLIVLGSRGMGGFKRLMLGSVSDGVLHHAFCPVMIVK